MSSRRNSGCEGLASSRSCGGGEYSEHVAEQREAANGDDHGQQGSAEGGTADLEQPGHVVASEQPKDSDHGELGRRDGNSRLYEALLTLALSNSQHSGEAAQEDVDRRRERCAVDHSRHHREQCQDHRRDAGVQQQRQQHAGGRGRDEIRQPGSPTGQLLRQHGDNENGADQDQRPAAVPVLRAEPPQPAEQQRRRQHRDEDPGPRLAPVHARRVKAK